MELINSKNNKGSKSVFGIVVVVVVVVWKKIVL
jgi:hypothetical protein